MVGENKLSAQNKKEVKNMIAAFEPVSVICEYLLEEYDITIAPRNISYYADKYRDDIAVMRIEYNRQVDCIPVANKLTRIKMRQLLVDDLFKKLWVKVKTVDRRSGEIIVVRKEGQHHHINRILDSVQREVEPQKVAITDPTGEHDLSGIEEARQRFAQVLDRFLAGVGTNGGAGTNGNDTPALGTGPKK